MGFQNMNMFERVSSSWSQKCLMLWIGVKTSPSPYSIMYRMGISEKGLQCNFSNKFTPKKSKKKVICLSVLVAHRFAKFLCSWDVEIVDSQVGQQTSIVVI